MKIKNTINPQIIAAAVGVLRPFVNGLTASSLVAALENYDDSGNSTENTRPAKPYTIPELMALLNVSKPTIYKLINNGTLKRIKAATCTRISAESVYRLLEGE